VVSTDSGVLLPQANAVIQRFLVLEDDIQGSGVAYACGVEVGCGVAAAVVEAAIVAAVREGTGTEPGGLAVVAVGHRRASPRQDM